MGACVLERGYEGGVWITVDVWLSVCVAWCAGSVGMYGGVDLWLGGCVCGCGADAYLDKLGGRAICAICGWGLGNRFRSPTLHPYRPLPPYLTPFALLASQGAFPDGPVAWMAAEVAERTLRWLENIEWLENRLPAIQYDPNHMDSKALFEQDIYNDAACSAIAGRPLYHNTLSPHNIR